MSAPEDNSLIDQTVDLISAYVTNNSVPMGDLAGLLATTHAALLQLRSGTAAPAPEAALVPAVPIRKSVHDDYIVCLEDGKKFKSLKRHLGTRYNLTPEAYRAKWNLPSDYPMVAPGYAQKRSELAKKIGLGRKPEAAAKPAAAAKPVARGRKKAA